MRRIRVIPVLLLRNGGLVKSTKFKNHRYVGDPINAVKILNEKEVDEIIILDIDASQSGKGPNIKQISEIGNEAFMPMAYGGGLKRIDDVKAVLYEGFEKVIFNYSAFFNRKLIGETARQFGSSSTVVSIDVKKDWMGRKRVFVLNGTRNTELSPVDFAVRVESDGAGEIFINSIDRDGTYSGYDVELLKQISDAVSIPVVACGGASGIDDFLKGVIDGGCSAVAAGSMFVFQRPHQAVLISYPSQRELIECLYSKI